MAIDDYLRKVCTRIAKQYFIHPTSYPILNAFSQILHQHT